MENKIVIECADALDFPCDVLVLKYAQAFYGADSQVADVLLPFPKDSSPLMPAPGKFALIESEGKIKASRILFVGVPRLRLFNYGEIRKFAGDSLRIVAEQSPQSVHIAMTMHGVGYGLDEREAFLSQIAGLLDAFTSGAAPSSIERVTIIEKNQRRANRLKQMLEENFSSKAAPNETPDEQEPSQAIIDAGVESESKPHIFVAMPFNDEMEDVYNWGIQLPVNKAGYLCERVDMDTYTGDILARILSRIESARLVIADLTGSNPNVYLEVGYAWGKSRPTLLLIKNIDEL
jgi:hypothetical protein